MSLDWLAGILEGEGCFYWGRQTVRRGDKTYTYGEPKIAVKMCDKDVVDKVAEMWDVTVRRCNVREGWSTLYTTCKNGRPALEWMLKVFPLMGERRRAKISELLGKWEHSEV